jgi:CheY-like chemotaxis protein
MTTFARHKKQQIKVLAVDDSDFVIDLIRFALRTMPVDVYGITSSARALKEIEKQHFSLIISDIKMPGMDGIELLGHLRKIPSYEKTPVLMLSGYEEENHREAAMQAGAFHYMQKPFVAQELAEIVLAQLQVEHRKPT